MLAILRNHATTASVQQFVNYIQGFSGSSTRISDEEVFSLIKQREPLARDLCTEYYLAMDVHYPIFRLFALTMYVIGFGLISVPTLLKFWDVSHRLVMQLTQL